MINVKFNVDSFYKVFATFEKGDEFHGQLKPIAEYLIEDIRQNWSSSSPSSPYNPPAIDTGNFDDVLSREKPFQVRNARGQFAKGWGVRIHTGDRKQYAQALESGTYKMLPRPYIEPALRRLAQRFQGVTVDEA